MIHEVIERYAVISEDRLYRYLLTRTFSEGEGICLFLGAYPTFADAVADDPVVLRCMEVAAFRGYREVWLAGAFAWRTATAAALANVVDPVGPQNDACLLQAASRANTIICAWGSDASLRNRDTEVLALLRGQGHVIHHLGLAPGDHPKSPLAVSKRSPIWEWREVA